MAVTREKKTLMMFVALLLFGALSILGYIVIGHNWNYTASDLDDTFGDMEDYTVFIYEGTIVEGQEDAGDQGMAEKIISRLNQWISVKDDNAVSGSGVSSADEEVAVEDIPFEYLDATDIADAYRAKGATVFVVNTLDPNRYEEGEIVQRGNLRIGFLGIFELENVQTIQEKVDILVDHGAERVVLVASNAYYVAGVTGVDMVIQANSSAPESWDFSLKGRYLTLAPQKGSIAITAVTGSIAKTKVMNP